MAGFDVPSCVREAVAVLCLVVACSAVVEADTVRKSQKPQSLKKVAAKTTSSVRQAQSLKGKGTGGVYRTAATPAKSKSIVKTGARKASESARSQSTKKPAGEKKKWVELPKIANAKATSARSKQSLYAKKSKESRSAHLMKPAFRKPLKPSAPQQPTIMNARLLRSGGEILPSSHEANAMGIIQTARHFLKTAYRPGGSSPGGFDCSGFTHYVFQKHGVELPRSSVEQSQRGASVDPENLRTGDLVFFSTLRRGISHVGIFIANGLFIHSASRGKGVSLDSISSKYWGKRFIMAKRVDLRGAREYAMLETGRKAG